MNYRQLTSPCGLDCFNCPSFLANNDTNLRAHISKIYGVPLEMARCAGCRDEQGTIKFQGDNRPCVIYRCTRDKAIEYCFECPEFPCDHLHPFADQALTRQHNTKLYNLCLIKKMGLEQWAINKAADVKKTYFNGKLKAHSSDNDEQ